MVVFFFFNFLFFVLVSGFTVYEKLCGQHNMGMVEANTELSFASVWSLVTCLHGKVCVL